MSGVDKFFRDNVIGKAIDLDILSNCLFMRIWRRMNMSCVRLYYKLYGDEI